MPNKLAPYAGAIILAVAGVLIYESIKSDRPSPAVSKCVLDYMRGQAVELRRYAVSVCEKEVADEIKAEQAKALPPELRPPDPPRDLPAELRAPDPSRRVDMKQLEEAGRQIYNREH